VAEEESGPEEVDQSPRHSSRDQSPGDFSWKYSCRSAQEDERFEGHGSERTFPYASQNLAHEVIKEARERLRKSEQLHVLRIRELAEKAAEIDSGTKQVRRSGDD
jgi:hypothetical protein